MQVLCNTIAVQSIAWLLAVHAQSLLGSACAAILWGLSVLRAFMVFHDCGHGSFFPNHRVAHWATLHLTSIMCATPTDWNVGHRLHHSHVGNLDQKVYDWGETVFHTAREFAALPLWKRRLWKVVRHPLPFFLLAPLLTWYVRMRLPFEPRSGRAAAYRNSNKALNTAWLIARYAAAYRYGACAAILAGDYLAMATGVMLFHLQHVYDEGYVRRGADWKLRDAAYRGSSFLHVPRILKFFTLGIEYHHIHHLHPRIPGYMLHATHESVSEETWTHRGVVPIDRLETVVRALTLQAYDESTRRYVTFSEAEGLFEAKRFSEAE